MLIVRVIVTVQSSESHLQKKHRQARRHQDIDASLLMMKECPFTILHIMIQ